MTTFDFISMFPIFHSSKIDKDEFEKMIKEVIAETNPLDPVKVFNYHDNGVDITLHSGDLIEIEVDWNEIMIS